MDLKKKEHELRRLGLSVINNPKYLLKSSWHVEKQNIVLDILKNADNIKTIVDVGFGTPQKYIKDFVLKNKKIKLTLIDLYDSAFQFARMLLNFWNKSWKKQVSFKKRDII